MSNIFLWYEKIQAYSQDDIISKIPKNVFDEIKQKDEHPFFQMYSVGHEGTFQPKIEGKPSIPITWTRAAIQSIKNVIKKGIKFFNGHNETISNPDKQELGEVIHTFEKEIDGKLNHVVIGYFPPETREIAKQKDVCSQESEWNLIQAGKQAIADVCSSFKGIALANSDEQKPAFSGAKRLAYIQAFEDTNIPAGNASLSGKGKEGDKMDLSTIQFGELMAELKRRHTPPSQAYSVEEIKKDREFSKVFAEIDELKTNFQAKEKELEDFKTKNLELDRTIKLSNAKGKLKEFYKELNYTENIQKFIDKMYDESKDKIDDLSDDGLKNFVESQKKIFQAATGSQDKPQDVNLPTGDNAPDLNLDENKYSTPDTNPLLKEAYDSELV
jgi:hypothetical protein